MKAAASTSPPPFVNVYCAGGRQVWPSKYGSPLARPSVPRITHCGTYPARSRGVNRVASIASSTWLSSSEK